MMNEIGDRCKEGKFPNHFKLQTGRGCIRRVRMLVDVVNGMLACDVKGMFASHASKAYQ